MSKKVYALIGGGIVTLLSILLVLDNSTLFGYQDFVGYIFMVLGMLLIRLGSKKWKNRFLIKRVRRIFSDSFSIE